MTTAAAPSANDTFKSMLMELAEAGMETSREMMVGVRKAADHDQRIAYGAAHERAARSVRLSISLYERLERSERETAAEPAMEGLERRVEPRFTLYKHRVRAAVRRSIEQEHEGEDVAVLHDALEIVLSEQMLSTAFSNRPLAEAVAQVRRTLNLNPRLKYWLPEPKDDGSGEAGAAPPPGKPAPS